MPNNFYHDPCNPCNPCPPVPECDHCHDCFNEPEKRCQPTYCGPVDTTKMCDYYDVQHMDCGCDCGYRIPKVPPLPPEFNSLTESQQLYGLDRKMNELICMVNGHNREVEKIYCEIVNSAKANDAYYWREIKTEEGYLEDASSPYKVVHIPFLDCGGQPIYLELGLAYNNTTNSGIKENVFSCSQRTFADKLVPAMNVANAWSGATVFKGAPITEINDETPDGYTFGVTQSGFLKVYKNLKDYKQMGLDKIRNAMMANSILMENGAVSPNYYGEDKETLQGRVGVGMNYNTKERFIVIIDTGATADMLANLFAKYNCTVAVELATGTSSVAMDKGAFMFMPAGIEPTTNPTVPEINAFWYITKRRHYRNDYVRDVASLTQKFGEQLWRTAITNGVVDNLKLSVGDLYTKLAEEIERAQAAEKQLQNNIDAEQTRAEAAEEQLQANIDAERERAEAAEEQLQANIDAEKERAEQAESELDERITNEVATLNERIDNEVEALENEDAAIRELIAQEVENLNQSIATETQERKNKSVVSVERIEEDGNRILYKLVLGDGTRLDVPVETYDYADLVLQLQKFNEYDERINAEAEARKAADDALGARITEEQNARQSADAQLQKNIEAETNARTQADSALQANIDAEKNRATQAETSLDAKISAETNRATEAEEALEQSITSETSAREAADTTLQDNIDAERERAVAQENTIKQSVTQEINRAQQAEEELSNDIQQETANRESAVAGVQNSLDEFKDYVQEDIVPTIGESLEKFNGYLPLAGGTMTGPLKVLSPTTDEDAANKKYVDERTTDIATFTITDQTTAAEIYAASRVNAVFRVDRAEDGVIPTVYANMAENKYTVWVQYGHVIRRCTEADGNTRFNSFTTDTFVYDARLQDQLQDYMPKSGGNFTGNVTVLKPVTSNSAVNRDFVFIDCSNVTAQDLTQKCNAYKEVFVSNFSTTLQIGVLFYELVENAVNIHFLSFTGGYIFKGISLSTPLKKLILTEASIYACNVGSPIEDKNAVNLQYFNSFLNTDFPVKFSDLKNLTPNRIYATKTVNTNYFNSATIIRYYTVGDKYTLYVLTFTGSFEATGTADENIADKIKPQCFVVASPVGATHAVPLNYLQDNYATKENLTSNYNTLNTKVETAQSTAEAAQSAASAADTKAGQAQTAANNAASAASAADTKAGNAQSAASAAQTTANEAKTAASNAQNTANTANSNANKALNRRLINVRNGGLAWPEKSGLTIKATMPESYLKYGSDITTVEALIVIPRETDPDGDHVNMSTIIKSGENWEITFNKANGEFYSNSQGSILVTFIAIGS